MNIYSQYSRLTDEQYTAIGRVAAHWSLVENALESILARIAHSPEYFGRALTNDLGIDNRIKALRTLCDVHEFQLGHHVVPAAATTRLRSLATEISTRKDLRNKIVHWIWVRRTDELMYGSKFRTGPAKPDKEGETHLLRSANQINQFAVDLEDLAARMEIECRQLPNIAWP